MWRLAGVRWAGELQRAMARGSKWAAAAAGRARVMVGKDLLCYAAIGCSKRARTYVIAGSSFPADNTRR